MTRDWFAVCAGPMAWFCAHVASWMLVPGAHDAGGLAGLYVVDLVALAVAVTAGALALGRIRALHREAPEPPPPPSPEPASSEPALDVPSLPVPPPPPPSPRPSDRRAQRARFLAVSGLVLSALSILLVIGLTLPLFLLVPGAEP